MICSRMTAPENVRTQSSSCGFWPRGSYASASAGSSTTARYGQPFAHRQVPRRIRPRRDRLGSERLVLPIARHLAGKRAAHVVVGRNVIHNAQVALVTRLNLDVAAVREALLADGDGVPPLRRDEGDDVLADVDVTAGPAVGRDERRPRSREEHGLVRRRLEVDDAWVRIVH